MGIHPPNSNLLTNKARGQPGKPVNRGGSSTMHDRCEVINGYSHNLLVFGLRVVKYKQVTAAIKQYSPKEIIYKWNVLDHLP